MAYHIITKAIYLIPPPIILSIFMAEEYNTLLLFLGNPATTLCLLPSTVLLTPHTELIIT